MYLNNVRTETWYKPLSLAAFYLMSKSYLYSKLLHKMGQYFLDTQYLVEKYFAQCFSIEKFCVLLQQFFAFIVAIRLGRFAAGSWK